MYSFVWLLSLSIIILKFFYGLISINGPFVFVIRSIPAWRHKTICLSIHLVIYISAAPSLGLLQIRLL